MPAVKELDSETGLYYFGARYLDPKTARWISGDPAVGDYIPFAPVSDEARKRNGSLPGQGGVFNVVNLHVYHYAGNNPVKYVDPDGKTPKSPMERQIEAVAKVAIFLIENKQAIQKIGLGLGKTALGIAVAALGAGGGAAITIGTGGVGTIGAVVLADLAVAGGAAIAADGVVDLINGIAMLSEGNRTPHGEQRYQEGRGGDPHRNIGDINRVRQEGKHYLDTETGNTIHVKGDKVVVDLPDGSFHSEFHNTRANTLNRIETGRWVPLE